MPLQIMCQDFIDLLLNLICIFFFLNRKRSWVISIVSSLSYFAIYFLLQAIFSSFHLDGFGKYLLALIYEIVFLLVYAHFIFEDPFHVKLFTVSSICLFSMLCICLSQISTHVIQINYFHENNFIFKIILEIIFLPFIYLFFHKNYSSALYNMSPESTYLMSIFPISGMVIILSDSFPPTYHSLLFPSMLTLFIVVGYILGFIAVTSTIKAVELRKNIEMLTIQLELQQENYKLINKSIEQTRAFEHDLRHHISTMKAMLANDNVHETMEYIEKLDNSKINDLPIVCKNFTIDSLLKHFMARCKDSNIDFKININVPEKVKLDDLDLSILLGNCIENAIEACEKLKPTENKFIILGSGTFGENLVFKIKNNFNGKIEKINDRIKSSKGNRLGIGLSNVEQIVKKYNGDLKIKYAEGIFEVCIVV